MLPFRGYRQNIKVFRWLSQGADAYEFTVDCLYLDTA